MSDRPDPRHEDLDRILHSAIARITGGISPTAVSTAWLDWAMHLVGSPNRRSELVRRGWDNWVDAWSAAITVSLGREGDRLAARRGADKRFRDPAWQTPPFNLLCHWFLLNEDWWQTATAPISGVSPVHQRIVAHAARQMLDMMAPSNFVPTNPEVLEKAKENGGRNAIHGVRNWLEDLNQILHRAPKSHPGFQVGEDVAVTGGDVVLRTDLIELIRYRPTTRKVQAEPILIVPAWIMKYYILDLSPGNSMVAYLRDQGFEVYIISWKNPGPDDAELGLADYLETGLGAALDYIAPTEQDRVHTVGYCLGGTLLAAGAAGMARDGDPRLASISLLAAQVDFTEPGELSLFINESQVAFLEDIMETQGYLRADQMLGAFQMLRSADLIWSRIVRDYLLGERAPMNDLMAWNADATRMPAKMHSEYLRDMFLENQLARGRFRIKGRTVALTDIRTPIFCLGTETDHVSPWRSVYKLQLLTDTDVTFCLTAGGHNSGVLSEPGHPRRHYRLLHKREGQPHMSPEVWLEEAPRADGSWWPVWARWLTDHSSKKRPTPAKPPQSLGPAPGTYVFG